MRFFTTTIAGPTLKGKKGREGKKKKRKIDGAECIMPQNVGRARIVMSPNSRGEGVGGDKNGADRYSLLEACTCEGKKEEQPLARRCDVSRSSAGISGKKGHFGEVNLDVSGKKKSRRDYFTKMSFANMPSRRRTYHSPC